MLERTGKVGRGGQVLRFGHFEVHLRSGELLRMGRKIPVQNRPFELLVMLLKRHGEMLSREELRSGLWSNGTFVDFDRCLNVLVAKLRRVLGDSAERPRYIETVSNRGYRFIAPVQPPRERRGKDISRDRSTPIRLAVLPLEGRNLCAEESLFAEGLVDELIVRLGQFFPQQLGVIARTSAARYQGSAKPLRQIGEELKADYILEGCVRNLGNCMRLTVQLIRVKNETQVWAHAFDCCLQDLLTLRNEIARAISRALNLRFLPGPTPLPHRVPSVKASMAYLRARHYLFKRTLDDLEKSRECFQNSVAEDPDYDAAYSGLAESYLYLGLMGYGHPQNVFPLAKQAALNALLINESLPEAYAYLGAIKYLYEWDWREAEHLFLRAVDMNPSSPSVHRLYGQYLSRKGLHDEALREIQRALALDPLPMITNATFCSVLYNARLYDEALKEVHNLLELDPASAPGLMFQGMLLEQKNMFSEAVSSLQTELASHPANSLALGHLGHVYGAMGNPRKAIGVVKKLTKLAKDQFVPAFCIALPYLGLNDPEQSLSWLEKAYQERSPLLAFFLGPDIRFDRLRPNPAFQDLLVRVGPQSSSPRETSPAGRILLPPVARAEALDGASDPEFFFQRS